MLRELNPSRQGSVPRAASRPVDLSDPAWAKRPWSREPWRPSGLSSCLETGRPRPVIQAVCCGIDGHAAQLPACLRQVSEAGQITTAVVEYGTTSSALVALRSWWPERPCPVGAMESTGGYWQPVSHVVSDTVEEHRAKSRDVRQRPGKQTDKRDAPWIAERLAQGVSTPSVVPPPQIRA